MSASQKPPEVARPATGGFTLIELLMVIGVVSVLMGIGVGYLSGASSAEGEVRSALGAQLRTAALTARTLGLPTEVRIEPGPVEEGPWRMYARLQEPILAVHFEPGERTLNPGLQPRVFGQVEPRGRYGHGRRNQPERQEPILAVPLPSPVGDLRDGFALRIEVLLEERRPAILARLGTDLELSLDGPGRLRARMVQRGLDGRGGAAATLELQSPLPLGRWTTVQLVHDGSELWCAVDGEVQARAPAGGSLHQGNDPLEISLGEAPVPGIVDEVVLLAAGRSDPLDLPFGVVPDEPLRIAFDRDGEPVDPPPIVLRFVKEQRTETLRVSRGGVLQ